MAVGVAWFVVALGPTSGLTQAGRQSMADRYDYLPSIGLLVAAVWATADGLTALRPPVARRVGVGVAAAAVVVLTIACRRQVGYWRDGRALFGHALAVSDENWVARYMMGVTAVGDHDYRAAAVWFGRALDVNPDAPEANDELGNCLFRADPAAAVPFYRAAIRAAPGRPVPYADLANALVATGHPAEAVAAWREAVRLAPGDPAYRRGLAEAVARRQAEGSR